MIRVRRESEQTLFLCLFSPHLRILEATPRLLCFLPRNGRGSNYIAQCRRFGGHLGCGLESSRVVER